MVHFMEILQTKDKKRVIKKIELILLVQNSVSSRLPSLSLGIVGRFHLNYWYLTKCYYILLIRRKHCTAVKNIEYLY